MAGWTPIQDRNGERIKSAFDETSGWKLEMLQSGESCKDLQ